MDNRIPKPDEHSASPDPLPENPWQRVLTHIEKHVSPHSFHTWFHPTELVDAGGSRLLVRVPSDWFADWLRTNYGGVIDEALVAGNLKEYRVEFEPLNRPAPAPEPPGPRLVADTPEPEPSPERPSTLTERYTFDNFVVSSCNAFAQAAARAVAEQPSRAYNPLYIYGGVGLGKTHLMQAIGNFVRGSNLTMRYISSEHFMNELINAIRFERTFEFKDRYRNVDLLLIDDIQFLAGKERTQEEFFHTFNALHDAQKQIVITSDVPPREIPTLEDRLRSRFEWGLIADIQPPDLETKVAILRKKAEGEGVELPDDVALFVAAHCGSNIRELEGAMIRLIAFASITGRPITLETTRETLRGLMPAASSGVTVESIQKCVTEHFDLKLRDLKSRSHSQAVAYPRQIAMYLAKQLTDCSLQEIGRRFGGKHHSTVIHSVKRIEKKRQKDTQLDKLLEHFLQTLQ